LVLLATAHASDSTGDARAQGVSMARMLADQAALDGRSASRVFLEGDFGDNVGFGDLSEAVLADGVSLAVIFDFRIVAAPVLLGGWLLRLLRLCCLCWSLQRAQSPAFTNRWSRHG